MSARSKQEANAIRTTSINVSYVDYIGVVTAFNLSLVASELNYIQLFFVYFNRSNETKYNGI